MPTKKLLADKLKWYTITSNCEPAREEAVVNMPSELVKFAMYMVDSSLLADQLYNVRGVGLRSPDFRRYPEFDTLPISVKTIREVIKDLEKETHGESSSQKSTLLAV